MQHVPVEQLDPKQVKASVTGSATGRKRFRIMKSAVPYRSPAVKQAEPISVALAGEEILHANSLATVTPNFIVVRPPQGQVETVIGLPCISKIKRIKTTRPGLLVIASAAYLLAAAAASSKQGGQAGLPLGVVGTVFVIAYFVTRRAAVVFVVDREPTETIHGSLSEAAELLKVMEKAQKSSAGRQHTDSPIH